MESAERRRERGQRMKEIRDALGETQPQFAERLNRLAKQLHITLGYGYGDVSARETGRKALDIEDYIVVAAIDPKRWSLTWLAGSGARSEPHERRVG